MAQVLSQALQHAEIAAPNVVARPSGCGPVSGGADPAPALLTVVDAVPITIVSQPVGGVKYRGESHTFSVSAANGTGALRYQWMRDGVDVTGATGRNLTLEPLAVGDSAAYSCRVSDNMAVGADRRSGDMGWRPLLPREQRDGMAGGRSCGQGAGRWALGAGGHLVTISGPEENEVVHGLLGGADAWIGYSNFAMDGVFEWVAPEMILWSHWGDWEPNRAGGIECVAQMRGDGFWNDLAPNAQLLAVAEAEGMGRCSDAAVLTVADGDRIAVRLRGNRKARGFPRASPTRFPSTRSAAPARCATNGNTMGCRSEIISDLLGRRLPATPASAPSARWISATRASISAKSPTTIRRSSAARHGMLVVNGALLAAYVLGIGLLAAAFVVQGIARIKSRRKG